MIIDYFSATLLHLFLTMMLRLEKAITKSLHQKLEQNFSMVRHQTH